MSISFYVICYELHIKYHRLYCDECKRNFSNEVFGFDRERYKIHCKYCIVKFLNAEQAVIKNSL